MVTRVDLLTLATIKMIILKNPTWWTTAILKKNLNKLQYLSNAMVSCHTSYILPNKTANIIKTKLDR